MGVVREGTRITHHPTAGPRVGGTSASVSMSPAPTSALWVSPADSRPKPSRHPTPPPRWPLGPIGRMRRAVRGSHIRSCLGSAAGVAPRPGALRSDALEAEVPAVATWPSPLASSASGAPHPQSFVGCVCVLGTMSAAVEVAEQCGPPPWTLASRCLQVPLPPSTAALSQVALFLGPGEPRRSPGASRERSASALQVRGYRSWPFLVGRLGSFSRGWRLDLG